jgi:hypothetical protein
VADIRGLHIGDDAELYALGVLDEAERRAIDAHLAHCAECRRRVGEAEETVLAMERHVAPEEPPADLEARVRAGRAEPSRARGFSWYALAAAFLIGLLPAVAFFANRLHEDQLREQQVAGAHSVVMLAMVHSHFGHAQFAPYKAAEHVPNAKVVFARDGSWMYILVDEPRSYGVSALYNTDEHATLGATRPYGGASELYVEKPPPGVSSVYLLDDRGKAIARAWVLNPSPRR